MSLYIDEQYLNKISPYFENFRKQSQFRWNCRCFICGDNFSQKQGHGKRGYFLLNKNHSDGLNYYCHKCGANHTMYSLLEEHFSNYFQQYKTDIWREKYSKRDRTEKPIIHKNIQRAKALIKKKVEIKNATCITELEHSHTAVKYCSERLLINKGRLYYTDNFRACIEANFLDYPHDKLVKLDQGKRLLLPFLDIDNEVIAIQGRGFYNNQIRYLTVKRYEDTEKVFGLDNIDKTKPIVVVEGGLDSLFIDNCVAVNDSNLTSYKKGSIFVFDNEPRNPHNVKRLGKAIDNGYKCVIWDNKKFVGKDINEMVLNGADAKALNQYIQSHLKENKLKLKMRFDRWRKI